MIVLDKDKVDERYNIDDNGIITDLNGNIQKTWLKCDRYFFHKVAIHKIQMWSRYGWRDTKIWDIHHIDKNPLNNNINNLQFLTHSEHLSLHKKGKNHPLYGKEPWNKGKTNIYSNNTKLKMSLSQIGNKNALGHHCYLSDETKNKMSKSHKGKHWKINPETGKRTYY